MSLNLHLLPNKFLINISTSLLTKIEIKNQINKILVSLKFKIKKKFCMKHYKINKMDSMILKVSIEAFKTNF